MTPSQTDCSGDTDWRRTYCRLFSTFRWFSRFFSSSYFPSQYWTNSLSSQRTTHWAVYCRRTASRRAWQAMPAHVHRTGIAYLPTRLPAYPLTYLPTYQLTCLPTYLPTYQLTCLLAHRPTHLLTYPPTYLPTYLPTNLSTYRLTYLPIWCALMAMLWGVVDPCCTFEVVVD